MLLPSFGILFDGLSSAAQSRFWFSSSTSLLSSTCSCLCGGFLRYSPLFWKSSPPPTQQSVCYCKDLHHPHFTSVLIFMGPITFSFFNFFLFVLFFLYFVPSPTDLVLMLTSCHRAEGDMSRFRPGEGVSSYFVTLLPRVSACYFYLLKHRGGKKWFDVNHYTCTWVSVCALQ